MHGAKTLPKTYKNAEDPILIPNGKEWNIHLLLSVTKACFLAASFVCQMW